MPVLRNNRQELFAQALAAGKLQQEAYVIAGYSPHVSNPSKLAKHPLVSARLAEILSARAELERAATEKAAESLSIDKAWIMARLKENAERAMQAEQARDHDGNPIGDFKYEGAVANRALELLGKELGMFIDRKEVKRVNEFDRLSDEDLARIAAGDGGEGAVEAPKDSRQLN